MNTAVTHANTTLFGSTAIRLLTLLTLLGGTLGLHAQVHIKGSVYGGGKGELSSENVALVSKTTTVEMSKGTVDNNVYGGGELGSVGTYVDDDESKGLVDGTGKTTVILTGGTVEQTVYGGGKGEQEHPKAGRVRGNTNVRLSDNIEVKRSVYGGGELGSVGTFNYLTEDSVTLQNAENKQYKDEPISLLSGSGTTTVTISGGIVGDKQKAHMPNHAEGREADDLGFVFCAGKGLLSDNAKEACKFAASGKAVLTIEGNALITASAYGGSENGQVLDSTRVIIKGGQIGVGYKKLTEEFDDVYSEEAWAKAIKAVRNGTFEAEAGDHDFHICDSWKFGEEGKRYVYDYFANEEGYYVDDEGNVLLDEDGEKISSNGGSQTGSDGHSFYGNVFGGGSGYYPGTARHWRRSAGRVHGDTKVIISGGHILNNVYGGNEITDVMGSSTIEMSGGTVGVPRSKADIKGNPMSGLVFGAGMGDPRVWANQWSNVKSTSVTISGDAVIFGSLFGGGEDGHVLGDAVTKISGEKVLIGTHGSTGYDGNVFGGGRGFSALALTAGVVCGNVDLEIENGYILGTVFGGGRLAAVGTYLVPENTKFYGSLIPDNTKYEALSDEDKKAVYITKDYLEGEHGRITVNITGARIGNINEMAKYEHDFETHAISTGDVFGGSKGTLEMLAKDANQRLGLSKEVKLTISGDTTHIYGNVYGGGSLASVGDYIYEPGTDNVYDTLTNIARNGWVMVKVMGGTIGMDGNYDPNNPDADFPNGRRAVGHTMFQRGHVYGSCLGRAGEEYHGFSYVNDAWVTVGGKARVYGSVFGGGEDGHVWNNTQVNIEDDCVIGTRLSLTERMLDENMVGKRVFFGNVYGGGRGIDRLMNTDGKIWHLSPTAGRVYGNTVVNVKGGKVLHNVYGGGSIASVGTFEESNVNAGKTDDKGKELDPYWIHVYLEGTGVSTVNVSGGRIGPRDTDLFYDNDNNYLLDGDNLKLDSDEEKAAKQKADLYKQFAYLGANEGEVYGSGRGLAITVANDEGEDQTDTKDEVSELAFVRSTKVTIMEGTDKESNKTTPLICGSVFGGGENGHVRFNTDVQIKGGIIGGIPLHDGEDYYIDAIGPFSKKHIAIGFNTTNTTDYDCRTELAEAATGVGKTIYRGNVYGGGRGIDHLGATNSTDGWSASAGRVYGNVYLSISGGHIYHHVYGGGSIASVGNYTYDEDANPTGFRDPNEMFEYRTRNAYNTWKNNTLATLSRDYPAVDIISHKDSVVGKVTVHVSGGQIGITGINEGRIYTSGRGIAGESTAQVTHLAFTNETHLDIFGDADVRGSVFGGGANGHVRTDAEVNVYENATIGWGIKGYGTTTGHWSVEALAEANKVYHHSLARLDNDKEGTGDYANVLEADLAQYKDFNNDGTGLVMFRGNVYGGGRGVDPANNEEMLSTTAGAVYGNTTTTVKGNAQVLHNVYGGGSMASVGTYCRDNNDYIVPASDANIAAWCPKITSDDVRENGLATVLIAGKAQIGYDGVNNNGQVYGSCRGIANTAGQKKDQFLKMSYCRETNVTVEEEAKVLGSVFGGGANGHVLQHTTVNILGGTIGSPITGDDDLLASNGTGKKIFYGNVYGGGRGIDKNESFKYSATAGRVGGSTQVYVKGGTIYHNVYGGGSLASVGERVYKKDANDDYTSNLPTAFDPDGILQNNDRNGNTHITISGGQIGTSGNNNGSVYGSGRGIAGTDYSEYAFVSNTYVTITKDEENGTEAEIRGSVFGSGENGHVMYNANVTMDAGTVGAPLTVEETTITYKDGDTKTTKKLPFGEACTTGDGYDPVPIYRGNVYGGGRGVDLTSDGEMSLSAGAVYGNTIVKVTGGTVVHNVYGGGSLASVGRTKYLTTAKENPTDEDYTSDTRVVEGDMGRIVEGGKATVIIGDGTSTTTATIGDAGESNLNRKGLNNGRVFGSGRGIANSEYLYRAYVRESEVNILKGAQVNGSVFGSGENGHVQNNTVVTIDGGTVGRSIDDDYKFIRDEVPNNSTLTAKVKENTPGLASATTEQVQEELRRRLANIGNVYGAGRGIDENDGGTQMPYHAGYVLGNTVVNIKSGKVYGNVYGGGSMALVGNYGPMGDQDDWEGMTLYKTDTAEAFKKYGGRAVVNIGSTVGDQDSREKWSYGGNVYGSSRGRANTYSSSNKYSDNQLNDYSDMAYVVHTEVNVGKEEGKPGDFTVYGNVYGGGENGHVDFGGTLVNILSGTVEGNVFGGGKGSASSPTAGIVDGNTQVNIGNVGQQGNAEIGTTINGNVYGGNDANSSALGIMQVDVYHTAHNSTNLCPTLPTAPTESSTEEEVAAYNATMAKYSDEAEAQKDENYALKAVYGGGNMASVLTGDAEIDAGSDWYDKTFDDEGQYKYISQRINNADWPVETTRKSVVYIHSCENTIQYVYGGANAADSRTTDVTIEGGRIFRAFAGGNGYSETNNHSDPTAANYNPGANIRKYIGGSINPYSEGTKDFVNSTELTGSGDVNIDVQGGIVYQVFGGSNQKGIIEGGTTIAVKDEGNCQLLNSEVFGGGNEAEGNGGDITLECGTSYQSFYGGARNATINGDINLTIKGGVYENIFGGNKEGGTIKGDVTVNFYGGNVQNLFGGSNMGGDIQGDINVNIEVDPDYDCADGLRLDHVYGGGKDAPYKPSTTTRTNNPTVHLLNDELTTDVFGGGLGKEAIVTANPKVLLGIDNNTTTKFTSTNHKVTVKQDVYGGGSEAAVKGNPTVQTISTSSNATTVKGDLYGGGLGETATVTTTGSTEGDGQGTIAVKIQGKKTTIEGNVFGGGNAGAATGNTEVTIGNEE